MTDEMDLYLACESVIFSYLLFLNHVKHTQYISYKNNLKQLRYYMFTEAIYKYFLNSS